MITGLTYPDIQAESFSLKGFYLRRVRRLAMALPVSVVAYLVLYPKAMRSFAASIALPFVSIPGSWSTSRVTPSSTL